MSECKCGVNWEKKSKQKKKEEEEIFNKGPGEIVKNTQSSTTVDVLWTKLFSYCKSNFDEHMS